MSKPRVKIQDNIIELGSYRFKGKGPFKVTKQPPKIYKHEGEMPGYEMRRIREKVLSFNTDEMAFALGLNSGRAIRAYESGERPIPGPTAICLYYMEVYGLPRP